MAAQSGTSGPPRRRLSSFSPVATPPLPPDDSPLAEMKRSQVLAFEPMPERKSTHCRPVTRSK